MKKNTKILLALGAIAAVAVAYHLHKKSKEQSELAAAKAKELQAAAVKPTTATEQTIAVGEQINSALGFMKKSKPLGSDKGKGMKNRMASLPFYSASDMS
jgi:uncharacterized protein YpmS